ncbi:MAG: hypothetical protein ACJAUM_002638 [Pseudomonadales bacterium]|jgi:hypothetical protein
MIVEPSLDELTETSALLFEILALKFNRLVKRNDKMNSLIDTLKYLFNNLTDFKAL